MRVHSSTGSMTLLNEYVGLHLVGDRAVDVTPSRFYSSGGEPRIRTPPCLTSSGASSCRSARERRTARAPTRRLGDGTLRIHPSVLGVDGVTQTRRGDGRWLGWS